MLPATTGELEFAFQMRGAAADTVGCWILVHTGCNVVLGRHD